MPRTKSTASDQILKILKDSPKTRKELFELLSIASTTLDTHLKRLVNSGEITYTIIETRKHRPSGISYFVRESNPKIRLYSLVTEERKEKQIRESSKNS